MIDTEAVAAFARLGVMVEADEPDDTTAGAFQVFQPCWLSVLAFLKLETQWRVIVTPERLIYLGLDYVAADVVLRRFGLPDETLSDLMILEAAALPVLNERD